MDFEDAHAVSLGFVHQFLVVADGAAWERYVKFDGQAFSHTVQHDRV
jgi:hypothetical protein